MKFVHLSDIHIGKKVNGFSMLNDQKYILKKIIEVIDSEKPDVVMIAGDVYDKTVPPAEAVEVLDDFLYSLSKRKVQVFIISGNHDSPERLSFGSRLIDSSGIHLSPVYRGIVEPFVLKDEYGPVNVYMLPFVKPSLVRPYFPETKIESYDDAIETVVENMQINTDERNVLIAHQFVTGASRSESEEISVGGTDNVSAEIFECFDYTALGHIHGPQNIVSERIRYCGTPLKYSFSEVSHKKSVTVLEMNEKGNTDLYTIPLEPMHDMVSIRGSYDEITLKSYYNKLKSTEDYMSITLTDEDDIPDAVSKLRVIYPNLMKLEYDNIRTRTNNEIDGAVDVENKTPSELFSEFYLLENGSEMSSEQTEFVEKLIEEIWEDEK